MRRQAPATGEATGLDPAAVRAQMERVLASPAFMRSPRMSALLRYLVERTLEGQAAYLKEYSIALDVFEREPDFDPQTNPVVRVQASKLRRLLSLYFLEDGRGDAIEIDVPRGSYVPAWRARDRTDETHAAKDPVASDGANKTGESAMALENAELDAEEAAPSIAVLPFSVLGSQHAHDGHDALAEGLLEEITTGLSTNRGVKVAARQLGRQPADGYTDVRVLGRELGVRFVLEGSVRAAGAAARIAASLVETRRGLHLWSDRFDAALGDGDPLAVQEDLGREVVRSVCEALGVLSPAAPDNTGAQPHAPERRQITVMRCQLSGTPALGSSMDPEDAYETLQVFQRAASDSISRYLGHIELQSSDGILAFFGYPQAHEDDAERSLRAGLDLLAQVAALDSPLGEPWHARVGIATGPVIIAAQSERELEDVPTGSMAGATLGFAEQLMGLAGAGELLVGPRTRRLAGRGFEYERLPEQPIPALGKRVPLHRVTGLTTAKMRFDTARVGELGPIVGRDEELGLLLRRWRSAQAREGQVVLIGGEPGIGKSRLAWALGEAIGEDTHWRVRYQCSPYHSATALYPIGEHTRQAARMHADDDDATRIAKLERLLAPTGRPLETDVPPIATLLGIAPGESYRGPIGSPERQRELLLDALEAQAVALSRRRPTLVIFEDVQWTDPTSLELFERVVERALTERILLVVTHRPDFRPPWDGYPHVSALQLARVDRQSARAIVERCSDGRKISPELTHEILRKTDGVPLFVEELTRAVVEVEAGFDAGQEGAAASSQPLAVPDTLQDALMARLDRLSPVKRVAQVAAAIGREFSYGAIEAVADVTRDVLDDALERLVESGLVFRRGQPPRASYQFKHALVQEAAYGTLLRAQRLELHARIAEVLETQFPERVELSPELLAHHLTECGESERAIVYWENAGQRSLAHHAAAESCQHFRRALSLLGEGSASELGLRIGLGSAILKSNGYHSPEGQANFERAFDLSETADAPIERFWALTGIFIHHWVGGDLPRAHTVYERLSRHAVDMDDPGLEAAALILEGDLHTLAGEPAAALEAQDRALEIASPEALHGFSDHFGGNPGVIALTLGAFNEWQLGRLRACAEKERLAREFVDRADDPLSRAIVLHNRAMRLSAQNEVEATIAVAEDLIELCTELGFDWFLVRARGYRGHALCRSGAVAEGLAELSQCVAVLETTGALAATTQFKALLAEAFDLAGDRDEAWQVLEQALEDAKRRNECIFEPALHCVRGDLLRGQENGLTEAEASYMQALETARARSMHSLALRPASGLATVWKTRRKKKRARELLESACAQFDHADSMPGLDAARALMTTL